MKYSTYQLDRTDGARTKLGLMTLCSLGLMAAIAGQQPVRADEAHTAKVSTAGLDLTTPAGVSQAAARVRETARRLCLQVEDLNDLSHHENYLACVETAMTAAMQQMKPAALAALGKGQEGAKP